MKFLRIQAVCIPRASMKLSRKDSISIGQIGVFYGEKLMGRARFFRADCAAIVVHYFGIECSRSRRPAARPKPVPQHAWCPRAKTRTKPNHCTSKHLRAFFPFPLKHMALFSVPAYERPVPRILRILRFASGAFKIAIIPFSCTKIIKYDYFCQF